MRNKENMKQIEHTKKKIEMNPFKLVIKINRLFYTVYSIVTQLSRRLKKQKSSELRGVLSTSARNKTNQIFQIHFFNCLAIERLVHLPHSTDMYIEITLSMSLSVF